MGSHELMLLDALGALGDAVRLCDDCHGSGVYPWSAPPKACWTCKKARETLHRLWREYAPHPEARKEIPC